MQGLDGDETVDRAVVFEAVIEIVHEEGGKGDKPHDHAAVVD